MICCLPGDLLGAGSDPQTGRIRASLAESARSLRPALAPQVPGRSGRVVHRRKAVVLLSGASWLGDVLGRRRLFEHVGFGALRDRGGVWRGAEFGAGGGLLVVLHQ